jgi:hypothetical protein
LWEYKLTVQLLRTNVGPIVDQWHRLKRARTKAGTAVALDDALTWSQARVEEVGRMNNAFCNVMNTQLPVSWGPPGRPGDVTEIESACEKLAGCAKEILAWEETVRFAKLPAEFEKIRDLLAGIAGRALDEMARFTSELARTCERNEPGTYEINLVLKLPDHWEKQFEVELKSVARSLGMRSG